MNRMKMPVLFLGHGSPMHAIEDTEFSRGFRIIAESLPKPEYILCISAHWETSGTFVTAMDSPKTIHDFSGFPLELYDVEYPAPGSPFLANKIIQLIETVTVQPDNQWGLDHGTWSVLRHLFPEADIAVVQLSIDRNADLLMHIQIAKELKSLRENGVLIIGSGNIVHNLRKLDWNNPENGYNWAIQAGKTLRKLMAENNLLALADYLNQGDEMQLAIPTPEHFIPALYALSQKSKGEAVSFFNQKTLLGAIDMTSFVIR